MSKGGSSPSGNTTTTSVSDPWSGQQPYLTQGFQQAQNLFNAGGPSYYPGQSYAGPTDLQLTGIENQANIGLNGTEAQQGANGALGNVLSNQWLGANPSNNLYAGAAYGGQNVNTGGYFSGIAGGMGSNPLQQGGPMMSHGFGGGGGPTTMPASTVGPGDTLGAASSGALANTQGQDTLSNIASGANLTADNPYFSQMADTIRANVLPQIQGQFNAGNRLDSGLASRAVGQGLGDSIGGLAYNNYQQGLQQQQAAAGQLGQLGQSNLSQQLGAANALGNFGQYGIQNQLQAANSLTNLGFGNVGTKMTGAQGLSQNFENAAQNQLGAIGLAPSIGNLDYQQAAALQGAGQGVQGLNQAAINDSMNRYNYTQQQPYSNLQNYMQNIQGNYGGTSSQTSPYFQNGTANALSTGLGAYTLGNALTGGQLSNGLGNIFGNLFGGSGGGIDSALAAALNGGGW